MFPANSFIYLLLSELYCRSTEAPVGSLVDNGFNTVSTINPFSLTSSFQKDKSGKLDVKEFHNLKHYVSVTKREYSESYEWQNPGFVTEYQMKNALDVRG